jgi:flagellar assembly factor FliW
MSGAPPAAAPDIAFREEPDMPSPCTTTHPPRLLESRRFGRLEVDPARVVVFPAGLLAFEDLHEYLRVEPEALAPLAFLVACQDPEVAFPILPAAMCLAGYAPSFPAEALAAIGAGERDPLEVLAICAQAPDTGVLHANLRGPVLINPATRLGCQVVLHDSPYELRHLLGTA